MLVLGGGVAFLAAFRDRPAALILVQIAWIAGAVFLGGALFLALAALVSSWMWDGLSQRVERMAMGYVVDVGLSWPRVGLDALVRFAATIGLALLAYGCGLVTAGVGAVVFAGWAAALDVTSNAFLRRGVTFGAQGARLRRIPGWAPFALACGVIALIPFVNVLMLPVLVVAGTLKVARAD